jgi:ABC-type glycerol-3-phosphate transport system substrate-binding protein
MSMFKIIIFGAAIVAALLAILIFSGRIPIGDDGSVAPTGQLSMWGTIPANNVGQVIGDFNIEAKTYSVNYRYIQESDFSQTLIEALANGTGPDMILAPHQIVLEQASKIAPFPLASFSEKAFKDRYVDGQ